MKKLVAFLLMIIMMMAVPSNVYGLDDDHVASYQELTSWLALHRKVGGTVYLSKDIVSDRDFSYVNGLMINTLKPVTIDFQGHTITVKHNLELSYTLMLTLVDQNDNDKPLFDVVTNGHLDISYLKAQIRRPLVKQNEGAILAIEQIDEQLKIDFADKPVIYPTNHFYNDPIILEKGQQLDETLLPTVQKVNRNYLGTIEYGEKLPVIWNVSDNYDNLTAFKRTTLTGRFPEDDVVYLDVPRCDIVYTNQGLALVDILSIRMNDDYCRYQVNYAAPDNADDLSILSYDEITETWHPLAFDYLGDHLIFKEAYQEKMILRLQAVIDDQIVSSDILLYDALLHTVKYYEIEGSRGGSIALDDESESKETNQTGELPIIKKQAPKRNDPPVSSGDETQFELDNNHESQDAADLKKAVKAKETKNKVKVQNSLGYLAIVVVIGLGLIPLWYHRRHQE